MKKFITLLLLLFAGTALAGTIYQERWTFTTTIQSQGDTGTASVIKVVPVKSDVTMTSQVFAVRVQVCDEDGFADATNATIAATANYGDVLETHQATKDISFKTQAAVAATETLTLTGVVIDGETFTTGTRIYEFATDGSVTSGNVEVDISAGATASQGTLTIAEPVTAGDTIQIGTKTYVFVANGTGNTDGEIDLGADEAATKVNIVAAINGTDGYNTANSDVTIAAFSADDAVITATVPGTAGDALATAEIGQGLTHASNVFDAATLGTTTAGVDCVAATADGIIIEAIQADSSAVVSAEQGAGTTVDLTAVTAGTSGNSLASTETMDNGAFGDTTMSSGEDAVTGEIRFSLTNATAETVTLRLGTPGVLALPANYTGLELDVTHAAP